MARTTRLVRALRTRWQVRVGGTDTRRWRRGQSFDPAWSTRHRLMANWVEPGDVVVDLGSGPRAFESHLPEGCGYIPVDIVDRGPGSVVCDLNGSPLPDLHGDFVLMSGVLEYIHDLPRFLTWTARTAPRGGLSYASSELFPDVGERRAHGWVNDCAEAELRAMLAAAGWNLVEDAEWSKQHVFRLRSSRA